MLLVKNTVVPNPLASFSAPTHNLSAELTGNPVSDTSAFMGGEVQREMAHKSGQANMALNSGAPAKDLDNHLSNEMANAAISEITDTSKNRNFEMDTQDEFDKDTTSIPTEGTGSERKSLKADDAPLTHQPQTVMQEFKQIPISFPLRLPVFPMKRRLSRRLKRLSNSHRA